jgi:pyruvate/2-oxoglutarate dehydrogenase complex dihydrolipoamide acyltransferase (E2) component
MHLRLPNLGIDDQPITLSAWLARRGSRVREGEPVVEVLCGGVTVELSAPADGVLMEKLAGVDERIEVGQRLALFES